MTTSEPETTHSITAVPDLVGGERERTTGQAAAFSDVVDGNTNDSDSFDDMAISDQDNEDAVEPTDDHLTADSHPDSIETAALSHLEKNDDDDVEAFDDLPIDSIDAAALDEDPHTTDVLPADSDSIDTALPYNQSQFWGSDTALSPVLRSPRRRHLLASIHDARTTFPAHVPRQPAREYNKWVPPHGEEKFVWMIYEAALKDDWETAEKLFLEDRKRSKAEIGYRLETPLHVAVETGKANRFVRELLAFFEEEDDDEAVAVRDQYGETALHYAARVGNKEAVVMLVGRKPGLMYMKNNSDRLPVQIAAIHCKKEILTYLIEKSDPDAKNSPLFGYLGVRLLMAATASGFFDVALALVEKYPGLAGSAGNVNNEGSALSTIARMASAFPGPGDGESSTCWHNLIRSCIPMDPMESSTWRFDWTISIADDIQNDHMEATNNRNSSFLAIKFASVSKYFGAVINKVVQRLEAQVNGIGQKKVMHEQALELVKFLCQKIKSLPYDEASSIYEKSIILAATHGNHEVVRVIAENFPTSIFARDSETGRDIFSLAASARHENVFNLIYDMSDRKFNFYNTVDKEDNNFMHLCGKIAPSHKLDLVPGPALQMQRELQWFKEVEKFVHPSRREWPNFVVSTPTEPRRPGYTPSVLFSKEHRDLKMKGEEWMRSTANSCSVAAALVVTIMFAAAFTVPGGVNSESGIPIFRDKFPFLIFIISDVVSLFTSLTSLLMFLSILTSRYAEEDFLYVLPRRSSIGLLMLFLSVIFMMAAFGATLYLMLVEKDAWLLITVAALACLPVASFVLLQFPLLRDVISSTYGPGIFGNKTGKLLY